MVSASPDDGRTVRFGTFALDPQSGELRRDGRRVSLQHQPFAILVRLLERPGEVVTREDLQRELWPDATYGDFEHGLNAAIKRLRDALGDSADNPRFIETLPKRGYRFVAPVTGAATAHETDAAPTAPVRRLRVRPLALATAIVVVGVAVVVGWLALRREPRSGELTILVADFVNRTGDGVFDDTLRQALRAELDQSPTFRVVSAERIRQTLKLMTRPPDERLTGDVALEVCQRASADVLLAGTIAQIGRRYVITVEAMPCDTSEGLTTLRAEADAREEVLDGVNRIGVNVRQRLGESAGSLRRFGVPISEATTGSLDALKAFSIAEQIRDERGDVAAEPYYVRAIELDREFALAYARLATVYINTGRRQERDRALAEAYSRRDRVSERERLYIDGRQCETTLRSDDPEKCFGVYESWKRTYPTDWRPHQSLCVGNNRFGNYSRALPECQEAVRLGPEHWLTYTSLVTTLLALGRTADAQQATNAALARGIDAPNIRQDRFLIAMAAGDRHAMDAERNAVRGTPEEFVVVLYQGDAAAFEGRIEAANRLYREASQLAGDRFAGFVAGVEAGKAMLEASVGYRPCPPWPELTRDNPATTTWLVTMLVCDDTRAAARLLPVIRAEAPIVGPARSLIAMRSGDAASADGMPPLAPARVGGPSGFTPPYLRGLALLEARRGLSAAAEFQRIVDQRGIDVTSPFYALAFVQAARAYAMAGEIARARGAYESFFKLWEHADPDVPILTAARSEYAALR